MKNVTEFDNCCGCGRCVLVCPVNAVKMEKNQQGFYYPFIDNNKCIGCKKCVNTCQFNDNTINDFFCTIQNAFAVKHKNDSVRMESRSGGVFTAISDLILDDGGVVYGCKLIDCKEAVHTRATTKNDRDSFRGSKYIQSKIFDCFELVKNDLNGGKWVLFSGTPCQVASIQAFCKGLKNEKLVCLDIICHSVSSCRVWKDYLSYLSGCRKHPHIVDFRDKKDFGWASHKEKIEFDNGEVYIGDIFARLFSSCLISRKDCFNCPYKSLKRIGDITIGDCWGIDKNNPELDDDLGVSLVLVNSDKGRMIWNQLTNIEQHDINIKDYIQPALSNNWEKPNDYDEFWKYYLHHSFKKTIDKYIFNIPSFKSKTNKQIKRIKRRIIKRIKEKI